jgi:hypothetical protein
MAPAEPEVIVLPGQGRAIRKFLEYLNAGNLEPPPALLRGDQPPVDIVIPPIEVQEIVVPPLQPPEQPGTGDSGPRRER